MDILDTILGYRDNAELTELINLQRSVRWTNNDISYDKDFESSKKLEPYLRKFVKKMLLFVLVGDNIILDAGEDFLSPHLDIVEMDYLHAKQDNESVHAMTYRDMVCALSSADEIKRDANEFFEKPEMVKKLTWLNETLKKYRDNRFLTLVITALAEGILFQGIFLVFDYVRSLEGDLLAGCVDANTYIRQDENLHATSLIRLAFLKGDMKEEYKDLVKSIGLELCDIEVNVLELALDLSREPGQEVDFKIDWARSYTKNLLSKILEQLGMEPLRCPPLPIWARGLTSEKGSFYEKLPTGYRNPYGYGLRFDEEF